MTAERATVSFVPCPWYIGKGAVGTIPTVALPLPLCETVKVGEVLFAAPTMMEAVYREEATTLGATFSAVYAEGGITIVV